MKVAFQWRGRQVVADYPNCEHDYTQGEHVAIYVASNDATNIGPTQESILDPSTHNPFDFIGPNGLPGMLILFGVVAIVAGTALASRVIAIRRASPG